jgi:hypothetical protein
MIMIIIIKIFWLGIFLFFNNLLLKNFNFNCMEWKMLLNNSDIVAEITRIDPDFFKSKLYFEGELFSIDIKLSLLNQIISNNNKDLVLLKRLLKIDERLFELFIFATDKNAFTSCDSILHTIKITSPIKKVKIVYFGGVQFAEFGTCVLRTKNNNVIRASFILVKHTGSSEELYNICKENTLLNLEMFRKNIVQLKIPRKLEMIMYKVQPVEKMFEIFKKWQVLMRINYAMGFCVIYEKNLEGFILETYDVTSDIQWYLRFVNLKHNEFIIKSRKEIINYFNLPYIKKDVNAHLKTLLERFEERKSRFIPIWDDRDDNNTW